MDKQKAMDYILNSPQNTNPSVLSSVLDSFAISDNKEEIELSATENKVYTPDDGKVYKKVTVNVPIPAIEGGSSDISTAHVEFISTEKNYSVNSVPCLIDGFISNVNILVQYGNPSITRTFDIPISENGFILSTDQFESIDTVDPPVLTGSISYDEDEDVLYITGDGTITCKGKEELK